MIQYVNAVIYSRISSKSERQDTERQINGLIKYSQRMEYLVFYSGVIFKRTYSKKLFTIVSVKIKKA